MLAVDEESSGADILRVLRRGISSIVSVERDLDALPHACREVVDGSGVPSPSVAGLLASHISGGTAGSHARFGLTAREAQVLRHLAVGMSGFEIARAMKIEPRTVKHHLSHVYHKLGVHNQTMAVVLAYEEGLVA